MTSEDNKNILDEKTVGDVINPYAASVNNLSKGLTSLYGLPTVNVEKQLGELTSKQEFLINQIHNENLRLSEVQHSPEIQEAFVKLKIYHGKLLNLKRDMKLIYERSTKLRKRALRLQQIREKEQTRISNEPKLNKEDNSSHSHSSAIGSNN